VRPVGGLLPPLLLLSAGIISGTRPGVATWLVYADRLIEAVWGA
jgi:hypothetical protein